MSTKANDENRHTDAIAVAPADETQTSSPGASKRGLKIQRRFSTPGVHPFNQVKWEHRKSVIYNEKGEAIFQQKAADIPADWSQLATDIVVSKYFRKAGVPETEHETSVRQVIHRVSHTIRVAGETLEGYFATAEDADAFEAELTALLLTQRGAFNSPVWFNCGLYHEYGIKGGSGNWSWDFEKNEVVQLSNNYEHPQCSACFIQSIEDDLMSIFELVKNEARVFKYGSGTGSNFSKIRGVQEKLSGGGTSSGLMSFLEVFDRAAGATKSGGTTRRAAKMVCLNMDHPEIVEFINWKVREEKKVAALIAAGYPSDFNGEAYRTVAGQNSNNSVRLSDEFMNAYLRCDKWHTRLRTTGAICDTLDARDLMRQIAYAAWACADPGVQFDTTINDWHTCSNTDRIHASNPCVTGDTLIATSEGLVPIDSLLACSTQVVGTDGELHHIAPAFPTGVKPVYHLRTKAGFELKLTADHRVLTLNRGDVAAHELTRDDHILLGRPAFGTEALDTRLGEFLGLIVGDGCLSGSQETAMLTLSPGEREVADYIHENLTAYRQENAKDGRGARDTNIHQPQATLRMTTSVRCVVDLLKRFAVLNLGSEKKGFTEELFRLDREALAAVLRGLFTADGTVANYGDKSNYIALDSTSLNLLKQTQLLLLAFGIKAKLYRDRRVMGQTMALLPDGKGGYREYPVQQLHSLRISRHSRIIFEKEIGFIPGSPKAERLARLNREISTYVDRLDDRVESMEFLGDQPVYDLTEPVTHHFIANGLVVHNCSEYMFLDDSACNLASINLLKFLDDEGQFDVDGFKHACRIFFIGQEILVDFSSYPTQAIAQNSHDYRPLGLGYANLGSLLMVMGIPYDSEKGEGICGAITALMCGEAYRTSAEMAAAKGAFVGFEKNRQPMLRVMNKHRAAAYRINPDACPNYLLRAAQQTWDKAVETGERYGYRNAQTTVLAPTGTIGLLMDCDTTGIEPDFALVKFKKLAGGGYFKIINHSVPKALERLGYTDEEIGDIVVYAQGTSSLVGSPQINTASLKKKGLNDEEIGRIEAMLPSVFELAHAFNVSTIGEDGLKRLSFRPEQYNAPDFDLLRELGFTKKQIEEASNFICGMMTLEGAPHLKAEHLAIFDCANRCGKHGQRYIEPMGHVRMIAAAQPFLSGSISKTINMPSETTVEEVEHLYVEGWKMGLKAVAIYRDGSKLSQPLSTSRKEKDEAKKAEARPTRRRLPDERPSITHKFSIGGHEGYITVGLYDDGKPGEVFLKMAKEGSAISGLMDTIATMTSISLQYGVPLESLVNKFSHVRFEPSGFTNNKDIPIAKSIIDYVFRWLGMKFLPKKEALIDPNERLEDQLVDPEQLHPYPNGNGDRNMLEARERRVAAMQSDAPACHDCGAVMVRNGTCYRCLNCGATSGCS